MHNLSAVPFVIILYGKPFRASGHHVTCLTGHNAKLALHVIISDVIWSHQVRHPHLRCVDQAPTFCCGDSYSSMNQLSLFKGHLKAFSTYSVLLLLPVTLVKIQAR